MLEDPLGELAIGELDAPADVVRRSRLPALHHDLDPADVVVDMQPVADIKTVAVERHLEAVDQVGDEERDDLLRELMRPVVVGAARAGHAHAIGAVVGTD